MEHITDNSPEPAQSEHCTTTYYKLVEIPTMFRMDELLKDIGIDQNHFLIFNPFLRYHKPKK